MEKVKEENRRKSEELEMLRRTMAQHSQSTPGQSESHQSNQSHQSYQSYHTNEVSSTATDSYDDYVMDFSKPAGYRPPPAPSSTEPSVEERSHSTPRRRSLQPEPEPAAEVSNSRPPIPPPPRRSPAGDGDSAKHRSSRGGLRPGNAEQDRQRSQFLEEIRRSASERMLRKAGE